MKTASASRGVAAAFTLCGVLLISACDHQPTPEVRHDVEPLAVRFPLLESLEQASWRTELQTNPRIPGPDAYWLRGSGSVPADLAAELRATPGAVLAPLPEAIAAVPSSVGPCAEWLHNAALDAADLHPAAKGYWIATLYVCADANVVAFEIQGPY